MESKRPWHKRRVAVTLTLFGCIAFSLFGLARLTFGETENGSSRTISIVIERNGFGPVHIEKTITIPVENKLSPIPGIAEIRSVSEYGKARISCTLQNTADFRKAYIKISSALELVYESLPASVRPPTIYSSGSHSQSAAGKPAMIIAYRPAAEEGVNGSLSRVRIFVEREIRPLLSKIDGTGKIEIGGGSVRDIVLSVDSEQCAAAGLTISELGKQLQDCQLLAAGGTVTGGGINTDITVHGKDASLYKLRKQKIRLPSGGIKDIAALADVSYKNREPASVAKINGAKHIIVYVYGSGNTPLPVLSKSVVSVLPSSEKLGIIQTVYYDAGEELRLSLLGLVRAVVFSALIVITLCAFFSDTFLQSIVLPLFLISSIAAAGACLSLLSFTFDHYLLASFALGTGLVLDIGIILGEHLERQGPCSLRPLRHIRGPVISSAATTIAVLLPFFGSKTGIPGGRQSAAGITALSVAGLFAGFIFLPYYLRPSGKNAHCRTGIKRRMKRITILIIRTAARTAAWALNNRKPVLITFIIISCCGAFILAISESDFSETAEPGRVFSHVEFEPGASLFSADARMDMISSKLETVPGILTVSTLARPGSGELSVRFDNKLLSRRDLYRHLSATAHSVPGCSLFQQGPSGQYEHIIELIISGPRVETLRETARNTAAALSSLPRVMQAVLHFKEAPDGYVFLPDRDACLQENRSPLFLAKSLWWQLHGSVLIKWRLRGEEIDIRMTGDRPGITTIEQLQKTAVPGGDGGQVPISRFGLFSKETAASKIYRRNRQRSVYISLHCRGRGFKKLLLKVRERMNAVPMPKGYVFEIDKKYISEQQRIGHTAFLAAVAAAIIYMILAAQFESFVYPLLILFLLPPILSFPIFYIFLSGKGMTVAALIGIVLLCGTVVNNGILIVSRFSASQQPPAKQVVCGQRPRGAYGAAKTTSEGAGFCFSKISRRGCLIAVRKRSRTLFLTTATSLLGAVPVLFLKGYGSGFIKEVAWVFVLGSAGSLFASFTFFPVLLSVTVNRKKIHRQE